MGEWEFDGRMVDIVWRVEGWEFGGRVEKDGQRPLEGVAVWPGCKPGATTYPRKKGSRSGRADGGGNAGRADAGRVEADMPVPMSVPWFMPMHGCRGCFWMP